ncbi:MAG: DUF2961 domain-containing protein [Deltaproteobacteria bacterium]|nr:DUF2961 domain-containing protein [Deltaproteobacteria bacterium]
MSMKPEFYHVTYSRYDADRRVTSFTGSEDPRPALALMAEERLGADPKRFAADRFDETTATVAPGARETLWSAAGAGAVWSIELMPEAAPGDALDNARLRIFWDGEEQPAVDAPFPDFFGSDRVENSPKALMMGRDGGRFYAFWPMPFRQSARVEIENRSDTPITIQARFGLVDRAYPETAGYFRARFREAQTAAGGDYLLMADEGAGHVAGTVLTMRSTAGSSYMEGDERIYTDASLTPQIQGTGTEDYFNGGWYFLLGPFSRALHGATAYEQNGKEGYSSCYRLHLSDVIPYAAGLRFGIEHDYQNALPGDRYRSLVFYYAYPRLAARRTDQLDVGDPESEAAHSYRAAKSDPIPPLTARYEGDFDDVDRTDRGDAVTGMTRFTMKVAPDNEGVILRRRLDQSRGRQTARVFVDGREAGVWYDAAQNASKRFADSDFLLPRWSTVDEDSILIRLEPEGGVPFTQFRVEAWSIVRK